MFSSWDLGSSVLLFEDADMLPGTGCIELQGFVKEKE